MKLIGEPLVESLKISLETFMGEFLEESRDKNSQR